MIAAYRAKAMRLALACVTAVLALSLPAAAQDAAPFHRGVGLFHPMAAASMSPRPHPQFVAAPFSGQAHALTEAQLDAIAGTGFDFVRLPVEPGPFLQFQGAQRDALDDILRHNVQLIVAHGLGVIVDFHPDYYGPDAYLPPKLVTAADAPLFKAYCAMLGRTAQLLASLNSDRVALELMNEPPVGYSKAGFAKWQDLEERLYRVARKAAPHLTLVLQGGNGGNFAGLLALDPQNFARDANTLFTFHYYYPYEG